MARWQVVGNDRSSEKEVVRILEADSERKARRLAEAQMVVRGVMQVPDSLPVTSPGRRDPQSHVRPASIPEGNQFVRLRRAGGLIAALGTLSMVVGVAAVALGIMGIFRNGDVSASITVIGVGCSVFFGGALNVLIACAALVIREHVIRHWNDGRM